MWELGRTSQTARDEIWLACARDAIFFIDTFLFGFNQKDFPDAPQRPFITYPFQERAIKRIDAAIGKHHLVIPKCRAVGGTYVILATFFHRWLFRRLQSFLLASAKEDRVDEYDDPSCLFWKIDDWLKCLPQWMKPATDRVKLRHFNLEMESVFKGESTNQNLARGGRCTAALADEAAAMKQGEQIMASLMHVTNTNAFLSTPQGAFGGFYKLHEKYSEECPERVIRMPWTDHPVYAQGLEYIDGKPTSPWYRARCLDAPGPRWIAQELDIEFLGSGGRYFEEPLVAKLLGPADKGGTVTMPLLRGDIDYSDLERPRWIEAAHGRLLLWCKLLADKRPPPSEYVAGCDVAQGMGGEMSSQSALCVYKQQTGEKVAEYKFNRIPPHEFARQAVAICRWFYDAKLIWGCQGPGLPFGRVVTEECGYWSVYYRSDNEEVVGAKKSRKLGYSEQGSSRTIMFSDYLNALHSGRIVNRSAEAVKELRQFIVAPNQTVVHSKSVSADDAENQGVMHGDIVVADALACRLLEKAAPKVSISAEPPYGSFAWRMRMNEREVDPYDWTSVDVN